MPRVKRSVAARKKRRKVLGQAKGYWGLKKSSYKYAKEQVDHSLTYAYRDRKNKKRTFRRLWIMLALGNPLHAFDFSTLAGGRVVVRRAREGEHLRTLDGVDRTLEPYDLMIADAERSVALAGIMTGSSTK